MDAMPAAMAVRVEGIAYAFIGVKPLKLPQRGAAPPPLPLGSFGVKRHEQRKSSFPESFIIISSAFAKKKKNNFTHYK
jgi:hypothetical protein